MKPTILLLFALLGAAALSAADRPNILFILADDLGWKDTAVTGSDFYRTPNIDRLAAGGLRFTDAYATPLCSPSRGAALTGRQPERFQMYVAITRASEDEPAAEESAEPYQKVIPPGSRSHLPGSEVTLAEILRDAGYNTHFIGKWHLGHRREHHPREQGFENVVVSGGAAAGYFAPYKWLPPGFSKGRKGEYLPERLTEETIRILREEARNDDPFFLALWHFNVHSPYEAKDAVVAGYEERIDPADPQQNPVMGAMVEAIDDSVGAVIEELERLGLDDETIVVFVSDNGGVAWPTGGWPTKEDPVPPTSNLPLRGWKGCLMEGGVRVPMILRWPGVTSEEQTNSVPVHLVDLLPTLAGAADAEIPDGLELDGIDLRPIIEGRAVERSRPILHYFPVAFIPNGARPAAAIRHGNYKLIRFFGDGPGQSDVFELYNVAEDPAESDDLATGQPDRVEEMAALLASELDRIGARIPAVNPNFRPGAPQPRHWRQRMLHP